MMNSKEKEYFLNAGFTPAQIEEICEGQKAGLNTAIYANKTFLPIQMRQIRLGMLEKLPVEKYAKVEFDWFQMEEIRKGLNRGVDVDVYAAPEISYEKMREIRKGLEEGVNLFNFLRLNARIIREIRKARASGVNILQYINQGYDAEQLAEIRYALEKKINPDDYISTEYRAASIAEICLGLENGIDVSLYAKIYYSWRQMREIRLGLENRIAVGKYVNKFYNWKQMREIRLGLEQGLDVSSYGLLRYTAKEMSKKRHAIMEREQERKLQSQVKSEDFLFEFTENDMEAYITVYVKDKVITKARLLEILEQNNIRKGIKEDVVEKIVSGRWDKKAMLIAAGQEPQKGEDGWYEFFFRTDIEKKPKILEDGTADYRNMEWFEMVKAGQKLAVYHEAQEGLDGYSVTGTMMKARKGAEKRILVGQGFRLEDDKKTYISMLDGMIRLENGEMRVTNHMQLDEVTMATGDVQFSGSIHILGDVGYGTVIRAADDIVIDGSVEGATIESGGSVVLKKGMNAAGHGMIQAEKDVVSRFFEAVKVVAKGNIEVDKCLNSQLYAGEIITSTRTIAGGVAQAERGFHLNHAGNQAGLHTVLKLKVNEKIWEEHRTVQNAIRDVKQELQMLNTTYEDFKTKFPPEVRSTLEVFHKVEKAVFTKGRQLEQLLKVKEGLEQDMKKVREAKIVITGQAHEGTVLEMDGCRWEANDQYNIIVRKHHDQMEVVPV